MCDYIKSLSTFTYMGVVFMPNKIDYNEIIRRIGFFRTKANLSARETSLRLGYSEQFIKRIENKSVELKKHFA